ncbi:MAG TPA: recombination-associated protein RdgC [Nitrosomonas nitrosa]|jgi:recombination associated protein RdgC|uniref:Recombination-associated protein RdgC n=1 Tax=Nitrosomonas nitrosa TaxID=52442 RepID=A0A8E0RAN5_9PROT|nr:recombination-associated protein RdgC [Nitrosomonas nitrosa]MCO6434536.1 recombination-associated protein RdgC [Nitrosomonas nitrosa]CAE6509775.1 Recombination-associated protein RdgC [Nitrosomonas nitrosa]HBZ30919.1 recombination-associated protein RdgC [Nitrosomonas nitrosa]HNP51050.1 recombination-associated protein RdgC [Nitrosomonas nitrosa]
MWFKNIQIYRIDDWKITSAELDELLSKRPLQNCLNMEIQSQGWVPPGIEETRLVYARGQQMLIALGTEKKLLPASVVNQLAKVRALEMEAQQGYPPGRKQMKEIKEAALYELLPRAFAIRQTNHAWIDPTEGWLVIDSASTAKADDFVEMLLKTIPTLAIKRTHTVLTPASAMTRWLAGDDLPHVFSIDSDSVFRSREDKKVSISYHRHPLDSDEITRHVRAGKEVTKLALVWRNRIAFILDENLQIKRLTLLDIEKEPAESAEEQFDSNFFLMTEELKQLLPDLIDALGGESSDQLSSL